MSIPYQFSMFINFLKHASIYIYIYMHIYSDREIFTTA